MPDLPQPLSTSSEFSRRMALRLLGVAAVGLLAGCRRSAREAAPATPSGAPSPTPSLARPTSAAPPPPNATPTPTVDPVVARAAAAENDLLLAYERAALTHPELASVFAPLRADHEAHLRGLLPTAATSSLPPIASPLVTSPNPSASAAASDPVLAELGSFERAAAAARLTDVAATSGSLARLLASIGGCEAAHAALLVGT